MFSIQIPPTIGLSKKKKKNVNSKFCLQTLVDTAMLETDVGDDVGWRDMGSLQLEMHDVLFKFQHRSATPFIF